MEPGPDSKAQLRGTEIKKDWIVVFTYSLLYCQEVPTGILCLFLQQQTGVNEDLIKRSHVILQVILCGHNIHLTGFREYRLQTARNFVELYPWFYMPTLVPKLLVRGKEIIASPLFPIGQMSEDAQESCNKLIVSLISSLQKLLQRKLKSLSPEVTQLIIPLTVTASNTSSAESTDYDTDDSEDVV
ncbi:hypothetical protein ILUMI_26845 [Ignelater luminosus]|uniref:Uncharacterized protein n=1 Tax=Ignelater luminosus TaxID=2038154 RepID=A0A8K0C5A8_IGNLU|nr:hypothetical protein ILUMI_26845 [Ignelater luminosus]